MIINFTETHATLEQDRAGVRDVSNVLRNYVRAALRDNHPSSSRVKLNKTAHRMVDRITSDTSLTSVRGALIPLTGNLVPHLARDLRMFNITPYQWVNNQLQEVPNANT